MNISIIKNSYHLDKLLAVVALILLAFLARESFLPSFVKHISFVCLGILSIYFTPFLPIKYLTEKKDKLAIYILSSIILGVIVALLAIFSLFSIEQVVTAARIFSFVSGSFIIYLAVADRNAYRELIITHLIMGCLLTPYL